MTDYQTIKDNELKSQFNDFSFSAEAQKSIRSEHWRKKYGLWTLLSAACEDAARKCYENINSFSDKLIDVDTCSVHSLKSIAKSVDLDFLCKGLAEDYPLDIMELIDLLSIPKHILLDANRILSPDSNNSIIGEIIKREISDDVKASNFSMQTLYEIKKNIHHIDIILNSNLILTYQKLERLLSEKTLKIIEDGYADNAEKIKEMTCDNVISKINEENDLQKFKEDKIIIGDGEINWFSLLIEIIREHFYNKEYGFYIVTRYFDNETNIEVDLTPLFVNILNPIVSDYNTYITKFICFHFYSLLASKLRNHSLRSMFTCKYDSKLSGYTVFLEETSEYEYSEEESKELAYHFMDSDEFDEFIHQKYPINIRNEVYNTVELRNMKKSLIDFIEYMKFISNFKDVSANSLKYDVLITNFYNDWPIYRKIDEQNLFGEDGILMKIAKRLTDLTLHICDIREQLKTAIQQYSIIRNKKNSYRHSC